MIALLVILFAAGLPTPKPSAPVFAIVPPSRTISLAWDNSVTPGCSNVLCYGASPQSMTNRLEVGTTNLCFVNVDDQRRFYTVRAVLDGRESEPSNVVKYPGDVIRELYVVKPDGTRLTLDTFTNTPPDNLAFWKLNVLQWERFDAP